MPIALAVKQRPDGVLDIGRDGGRDEDPPRDSLAADLIGSMGVPIREDGADSGQHRAVTGALNEE